MTNEDFELIDIKNAANKMRLSFWTLYTLVRRKKIPYTRLGGRIYFRPKILREWLEKNTNKPEDDTLNVHRKRSRTTNKKKLCNIRSPAQN